MKINILTNNEYALANYVNLNPMTDVLSDYMKQHASVTKVDDLTQLEHIVDFGEAEEIRIIDVINHIRPEALAPFIGYICKKVAHKGTIVITAYDSVEICISFLNGSIDINKLNSLCAGNSHTTLSYVKELLIKNGFVVQHMRFDDLKFTIVGVRP